MIAHLYKDNDNEFIVQSTEEHSKNVANICSEFAKKFDFADFGYIMGYLHDAGKETNEWQSYINYKSGYDLKTYKSKVEHSYIGAKQSKKLYPSKYCLMANPICGHHRGLYDRSNLEFELLKEDSLNNYTFDCKIDPQIPNKLFDRKDINHIIRMLFSCLVDADRLDTEKFMDEDQSILRSGYDSIPELLNKLELFFNSLNNDSEDSEVNRIRRYVQEECRKSSKCNTNFYNLTVPTGGGKTLASLLWALRHAKENNLDRIIIAIPYTSIITQTASILKSIFGEGNILEHHSNFDYEDVKDPIIKKRMMLATDNWDFPIIVTTNVQLFESLFSNKPKYCRKLHNLSNSVLILDEVQTLPLQYLKPIVNALDTLHRIFNVSVLFTTASQPTLVGQIKGNKLSSFTALSKIIEIIPSSANLHNKLRRVQLEFDDTVYSHEQIAGCLSKYNRVLCIVNSRADAKGIFDYLPKEGMVFHLSRMMCSAHIKKVLIEIKNHLTTDDKNPIRVVATQLIEAGVDIDFPVVYRQNSGLDSILQAAGRCNREGKLKLGSCHVFKLKSKLPKGLITQADNAMKNMGKDWDWFSQEAMNEYFKQLYFRTNTFDINKITEELDMQVLNFETAADNFKLIDDSTIPVVVSWENSLELLYKISTDFNYKHLQKLYQYTVSIKQKDFQELKLSGIIEEFCDGIYYIKDKSSYSEDTGLSMSNHFLEETIII